LNLVHEEAVCDPRIVPEALSLIGKLEEGKQDQILGKQIEALQIRLGNLAKSALSPANGTYSYQVPTDGVELEHSARKLLGSFSYSDLRAHIEPTLG